jgi:hypothetical protein
MTFSEVLRTTAEITKIRLYTEKSVSRAALAGANPAEGEKMTNKNVYEFT